MSHLAISAIKNCLWRMISLKCLLISSFIILMTISGFLGYILTSIQSQKSMNELAENNVFDLANSVLTTIQTKIDIGHQMNLMESLHASSNNIQLDNWVAIWQFWRPLSLTNLRTVAGLFFYSAIIWEGKFAIAINTVQSTMSLVNFNNTICSDPIHFPGSNCSLIGGEIYPMNVTTGEVMFYRPIIINYPFNVLDMPNWKSGPVSRLPSTWRSTVADPYSPGYSEVFTLANPVGPSKLFMEINAALLDDEGRCIGQIGKEILLTFVGEFLHEITTSNKILIADGRAFALEIITGFLTGASHGGVYRSTTKGTVDRIFPRESSDAIIAEAGRKLIPSLKGRDTKSFKVNFQTNGKSFICACEPLIDQYGLAWMAAVVLSLTDLFREMNSAAMQMLGWTALCILVLSILAGLTISFLVTRPLHRLSYEMEAVSEMNLENIDDKRSFFYEISTMQGFFHKMVSNLKEFRTFLPEAILNDHMGSSASQIFSETGNLLFVPDATPSECITGQRIESPRRSSELVSLAPGKRGSRASLSESVSGAGALSPSHRPSMAPTASAAHRQSMAQPGMPIGRPQRSPRRRSLNRQVGALSKRTVSVLHVDMKSFHSMMDNDLCLMTTHKTVMQKVQEIAELNAGLCGPIIGDKMMVFWNVKFAKSEHATFCMTSAMQLYETLKLPNSSNNKKSGQPKAVTQITPEPYFVPVYIACTMGSASFGTLGTQTSRAFTVISPCVSRGAVLQKLSKLIPLGVVCDGLMHERIEYNFISRLVAYTGSDNEPHSNHSAGGGAAAIGENRVYEVLGLKNANQGNEEWMYELKDQEKETNRSKEAEFIMAIRALFNLHGQPEDVRRHLQAYLCHASSDNSIEASNGNQLVQWYLEHVEGIQYLMRSPWGFALPIHHCDIHREDHHQALLLSPPMIVKDPSTESIQTVPI